MHVPGTFVALMHCHVYFFQVFNYNLRSTKKETCVDNLIPCNFSSHCHYMEWDKLITLISCFSRSNEENSSVNLKNNITQKQIKSH